MYLDLLKEAFLSRFRPFFEVSAFYAAEAKIKPQNQAKFCLNL